MEGLEIGLSDADALVTAVGPVLNTVTIGARGYATVTDDLPGLPASAVRRDVVPLEPQATLSGTLTDGMGQPLEGIKVALAPPAARSARRDPLAGSTDAAGRFRFERLATGPWSLTADGFGWLASDPQLVMLETGVAQDDLLVVLDPAGSLAGTVRDTSGGPAPGVLVQVALRIGTTGNSWGVTNTGTDAGGRFEVLDLEPNTYRLLVDPGVDTPVAVPAGRRVELELSLRQRPVVRGRVLVGGRPTPGIHVMARATSDDGRRQAPKSQSSGADGRFELELAAQGTCVLQAVSPAGGSSPEAKVHVRWGERREQDLVFGDGELRGRVEAADGGAPVPDAAVRLRGLGEELTEWLAVDAASTFRFADLAPGTYFVEAVSPDLANVHSEPIVIDGAGPTAMLVLRLERGARLLGSVHYADGDSHADVVHLLRRDDPLFHRSATPEDGAFAFGGLAAGSYRLLLTKAWADPLTDDEHEDAGNVVQECGLVIDGPGVHRRDIVVP